MKETSIKYIFISLSLLIIIVDFFVNKNINDKFILTASLLLLLFILFFKLKENLFFSTAILLTLPISFFLIIDKDGLVNFNNEAIAEKFSSWFFMFIVLGLSTKVINTLNKLKPYFNQLILLIFFLSFWPWFLSLKPIASGDIGYYYQENLQSFFRLPPAWESIRNAGLGGRTFFFLSPYVYLVPMGFLAKFFDFAYVERLIWFWPIFILSIISPYILLKTLKITKKTTLLSSLIYGLNTYFLMIVSGGQISVALGYVFIPLAIAVFLKTLKTINIKNILLFSLCLFLLDVFDHRFLYLFFIIAFLFFVFSVFDGFSLQNLKQILTRFFKIFLFTGLINLSLHAYWLLPALISRSAGVNITDPLFSGERAAIYFSFADFSQSLSLFHHNWPDNIFGKANLLRFEFIVLPALAFSALFFVSKEKKKNNKLILFFALLSLTGAFLGKGTNEPFGLAYLKLFKELPGMAMFRDPSKFYTLTAIGYSLLIPYTLERLAKKLKKRDVLVNFFFVCFWLFLIYPVFIGQVKGTLKPKSVPEEYFKLKDYLSNQKAYQKTYFRTLWLPTVQRFAFFVDDQPAIPAKEWSVDDRCRQPFCNLKIAELNRQYFQCPKNEYCFPADLSFLANPKTPEILADLSIKYLIIPYDSEAEIFLKERKYDDEAWQKTVDFVSSLSFLDEVATFGKIKVYKLKTQAKDHFWSTDESVKISFKKINLAKYEVDIKATKPFSLMFSENYDQYWQAGVKNGEFAEQLFVNRPHNDLINGFDISKTGEFKLEVEFKLQKYVDFGLMISILTFVFVLASIVSNFALPFFKGRKPDASKRRKENR